MKTPGFDAHQLLIAAEAAILGRSEVVPNGNGTNRKSTSWTNRIVIALVVVGAFVIHSWVSWRRNRELAKLRHQRNVVRIKAENKNARAKVAEHGAAARLYRKQRDKLEEEYRLLDAEVRAEMKRYYADIRAIDRISDWSELGYGGS